MLVNTASWTRVANAKITSSAAVIALLTPPAAAGSPLRDGHNLNALSFSSVVGCV